MKHFFIIFGTFITTTLFGQTDHIKVKKPLTQDNMVSVVTIGGKYEGKITVADLLTSNQFIISNNINKLKIISYTASTIKGGLFIDYSGTNDTLSEQIKTNLIVPAKKGTLLLFTDIKAVSETKDTVKLNPIVFHIK